MSGNCEKSPGVQMMLDAKILKETVTFSQWASKMQLVTIKGVEKNLFFHCIQKEPHWKKP